MNPSAIDKAADLIGYYFATVWKKAGLKWEYDNDCEMMRELMRRIIDAVKEEGEK